jgi:hypothetical protein
VFVTILTVVFAPCGKPVGAQPMLVLGHAFVEFLIIVREMVSS